MFQRTRALLRQAVVLPALGACFVFSPAAWAAWSNDPAENNLIRQDAGSLKPFVTEDGSGGAIIVWSYLYDSVSIRAQRVDASGTLRWDPEGVPVRSGTHAEVCSVHPDGEGGAFIVWWEGDSSGKTARIMAQRIDGSGTLLWPEPGVETGGGAITKPDSAVGSDGGLLVLTQQSDATLYLQALDRDGVKRW